MNKLYEALEILAAIVCFIAVIVVLYMIKYAVFCKLFGCSLTTCLWITAGGIVLAIVAKIWTKLDKNHFPDETESAVDELDALK